ncbi:PREDICTED: E3 ubiquitin-protein ligase listerin-like [Nicrophorus vespilloides]|uniref:E3 ubiquitin-protein ligase listerin n=1 Tax=Nicrophorus vespilloides TaxID=110193 RepID=A0ABM1M8D7_NICVS|nr:PREDICTED: E3 ubiquitin-protein ligase listerin-like [Nicrophorus vespilloides]
MEVEIFGSIRAVTGMYTIDESKMELVIGLPPNYPLRGPRIIFNGQIKETSLKPWLIQLQMRVLLQNERIWEALSLWNNNLDKKFNQVEECTICFGVFRSQAYQLPDFPCKTCRKKFHPACLHDWFSSSNRSSCPMCRNQFPLKDVLQLLKMFDRFYNLPIKYEKAAYRFIIDALSRILLTRQNSDLFTLENADLLNNLSDPVLRRRPSFITERLRKRVHAKSAKFFKFWSWVQFWRSILEEAIQTDLPDLNLAELLQRY